ncbi:MAG: hypothetical protein K1X94_21780 [Sandaracinaceae bacterium]|nr:hypothetical protein [Sandaracinaceae bacterium]
MSDRTASSANPFDRFELDPHGDLATITDALRERAEDAGSDEERAEIRAAWEAMTLHPQRRLELALTAVPETRAPIGVPPRRLSLPQRELAQPLALTDLVAPPSLASELDRTLGPEDETERALWGPALVTPTP